MKTLIIAISGLAVGVALIAAPDTPAPAEAPKRETAPAPAADQPQPRIPFKAAPPAMRPAPQKGRAQNQPSLVTVEKIPSQTGLTPGIYTASPYTGIVVIPSAIDPEFVVGVGDTRLRMPAVEPPLTLKPRNQPVPKPAEGPAPKK